MNELIKTIIITSGEIYEVSDRQSIKDTVRDKLYNWIEEEYDKGWLIEILRFDFYNKDIDTNQYCDVSYRAIKDPVHVELLERMEIGL